MALSTLFASLPALIKFPWTEKSVVDQYWCDRVCASTNLSLTERRSKTNVPLPSIKRSCIHRCLSSGHSSPSDNIYRLLSLSKSCQSSKALCHLLTCCITKQISFNFNLNFTVWKAFTPSHNVSYKSRFKGFTVVKLVVNKIWIFTNYFYFLNLGL